jgi:hypothetical protein
MAAKTSDALWNITEDEMANAFFVVRLASERYLKPAETRVVII